MYCCVTLPSCAPIASPLKLYILTLTSDDATFPSAVAYTRPGDFPLYRVVKNCAVLGMLDFLSYSKMASLCGYMPIMIFCT